ncbi:hypothetical protein TYRP_000521 [Tyrophagus putrescentiae]|nr:hypothetical protein TYRP_000521 [Tyrophagus putrescentiae]
MLDSCQTSSPGHSLSGDGGGELKWSWSEVDKRGSLTPSSALHCGRHSCQSLAMAPAAVSLSEREHTAQCDQPESVGRQCHDVCAENGIWSPISMTSSGTEPRRICLLLSQIDCLLGSQPCNCGHFRVHSACSLVFPKHS